MKIRLYKVDSSLGNSGMLDKSVLVLTPFHRGIKFSIMQDSLIDIWFR